RRGILGVAARGWAGIGGQDPHEAAQWTGPGMDWTAWFLAFKGVVLEGLEVAFIVVTFGAGANHLIGAAIGGGGGGIIVGGIGLGLHPRVRRISRSLLPLL